MTELMLLELEDFTLETTLLATDVLLDLEDVLLATDEVAPSQAPNKVHSWYWPE
jgi:hypothetical protein